MSALGLKTILISNVVNSVGLAIITNEAEGSTDAEDSVLGSSGLNLSRFVTSLSVGQLVGEPVAVKTDVVGGSFAQDVSWFILLSELWSGKGDGHEGSESNDLQLKTIILNYALFYYLYRS